MPRRFSRLLLILRAVDSRSMERTVSKRSTVFRYASLAADDDVTSDWRKVVVGNETGKWTAADENRRPRLTFLFQITKLKIDSNPFAKGFRDSSRLTDFER